MYRNIRVASARAAQPQALGAALFGGDDKSPVARRTLPAGYRALDQLTGGALAAAWRRPEFSVAKGETVTLYPTTGPSRLIVVGLGEAGKFTPEVLRAGVAKLLRAAFAAKVTSLGILVPALTENVKPLPDPQLVGRAIGDALAIANLKFTKYKGQAKARSENSPKALDLTVQVNKSIRSGVERSLRIGASVNLARTLAATPPNFANPGYLVAYCRDMARKVGLRCSVIDAKQAARLHMGGLLAVGGAGSTPPALICLEWIPPAGRIHGKPKTAAKGSGPILLVGKAVTFDTGGYSLKPNDLMVGMKYDKCGGAAVIGALHAAASLKLPVHVVGLIPAVENMIASTSYRPDDILTMGNGVTVEVTNTDAEGRLILGDALAYGCKTYQPDVVIDLATLTGGVVVALGNFCAGLFSTTQRLRAHLSDAADFAGERLWPLPLWNDHLELIKGTHADIVNSARAKASPIQGAAFLSYFTGRDGKPRSVGSMADQPGVPAWAHLDIAGVADVEKDTPMCPVGPTGFGVRLLVRAMETWDNYRRS